MREIVFDLETTGLDPKSGHRIVEVGCVELIDRKITGQSFHTYVNPERDVPVSAQKIHGITTEFLKDKPVFSSIVKEFLGFIAQDRLIIHNASFDMGFINHQLVALGKPAIAHQRAMDTLEMARKKFPGAKATLDALCVRYNISLERRDKHGALLDAELLAEVYIQMMGGYQNAFNLQQDTKNVTVIAGKPSTKGFPRLARPFPASEEEIELHTAFMQKIKK